jgi:hypothetical protein
MLAAVVGISIVAMQSGAIEAINASGLLER